MLEFWDFSGSPDYDLEESGQLQRDIVIESADSSPKAETQLRRIPELGLLKHGWAGHPVLALQGTPPGLTPILPLCPCYNTSFCTT